MTSNKSNFTYMKLYFFIALSFLSFFGFSQNFPVTKKVSTLTEKHNIKIKDDYAWLQNLKSEEVVNWVNAQNSTINEALSQIKVSEIASKIKEYSSLSSNSFPLKKGKYFYFNYRKNKNLPACLFYSKYLNQNSKEVIDPFSIYKDENVRLGSFYPSSNSTLIAYQISLDGSDRKEIHFSNIDSREHLKDIIKDFKLSNIVWNGDKGVFYKKNSNKNVMARDSTYQLYYHAIGTNQEDDKLIYDVAKKESSISFTASNNKLLIIEESKEELQKSFYYIDLNKNDFEKETIIENDTSGLEFLHFYRNKIYFSSKEYDWGEVRCFDINNKADIKVVVPQIYNTLLVNTRIVDNYIICKYKTIDKYYMSIYDLEGNFIRKFDTPENMDFQVQFYNSTTKDLYVTYSSYIISAQNYKLNIETGDERQFSNEYIKPMLTLFPLDYFITKKITYKSRDNKDIPITIIHKKGIVLDGNNPTLLKAYGGFGTISEPNYDSGLLYFLEKGGVFAFAEIRGGGEKGTKWHKDGIGLKKMNSFNDFIDASEFLIKEKYTSPNKLAITGGSYGGLVVGVAMTQRPDLYKVAVPKMGIYDMPTFSDYSVGKYHIDEFGDAENKIDFENLLSYSPYQNIKENVNYPTSLIITGENDDRVPPFNSYKFAAALQNRTSQKNPVFLKTLENSGHYGNNATYQNRVNEKAEFYGFILYYLNK